MTLRHIYLTQFYILIFSLFLIYHAQAKLETGSACFIENINSQEIDPCPRLHYCEQGQCTHKSLANPQALEILCYCFVFILSGIACASGVGASYTLAPIIVMLSAYSANAAIRIVYCLIFGGMVAAFLIKCSKRDPETKMPLIQYELCLVCLPIMVLGTTYGVLLNIILAPLVIAICLIITMIVSLIRIQRKIKLLREQEKKKKEPITISTRASIEMNIAVKEPTPGSNSPDNNKNNKELIEIKSSTETEMKNLEVQGARFSEGEILNQNEDAVPLEKEMKMVDKNVNPSIEFDIIADGSKLPKLSVEISEEIPPSQELLDVYKYERRLFPKERFIEFALLFGALVLLALMRGTSSLESIFGAEYCSGGYWGILMAVVPCMLLFHWRGCHVALKADERRVKANYPFKDNQFRLDKKMLNPIRILCLVAGFLSGAAGVGVGVIVIPYFLGKGMKSACASATAGFFNIFTAFTSMLLAVLGKDLKVEEMIFYCLLGFFGSGICCLIAGKLSAKLKINYLEVLMVWLIVIVGLFVSPGQLLYMGLDNPSGLVSFKSLC